MNLATRRCLLAATLLAASTPAWAQVGPEASRSTRPQSRSRNQTPTSSQAGNTREVRVRTRRGPQTMRLVESKGYLVAGGDMIMGTTAQLLGGSEGTPELVLERSAWPGGVIPYHLTPGYLSAHQGRERWDEAVAEVESRTGLRLLELSAAEVEATDAGVPDHVKVEAIPEDGCQASLGYSGGRHTMNASSACTVGNHVHEILHLVGISHEHTRPDRNQYVWVYEDRIDEDLYDIAFAIGSGPESEDPFPYDFGSIMHYPARAFPREGLAEGLPTLEPLEPLPAGVHMGQRERLSEYDVALVNLVVGRGPGDALPTSSQGSTAQGSSQSSIGVFGIGLP